MLATESVGHADRAADQQPLDDQQPLGEIIAESASFFFFGLLTVVASLAICLTKDIVRMAVWLFVALGAVAVIYFLLAAPFVAVIQLIVYAGGTLLLLVFGVMLTSKSPWASFKTNRSDLVAGGFISVVLAITLVSLMLCTQWPVPQAGDQVTVASLGQELLTTYLVPFEAVSVLLLVVMIAAAYLAKQEK